MTRTRPPSPQTRLVFAALLDAPAIWRHGYALSQRTGLKSGTLYPILMRLADHGWLETRWEEPERPGRPARHTYRLTAEGMRVATEALAQESLMGWGGAVPRPEIEAGG